jgi:hypothetical protein
MTISELVDGYLSRIASSYDKAKEISFIEREINNLTYTSNNQPISVEDKISIWERIRLGIQRQITSDVNFSRGEEDHKYLITEATSNVEILKMVAATEKKLKGK